MALTATIGDLTATIRHIGRGSVFYQVGAYAGSGTDLTLVYLGDSEGEITVEENAEFSELTTPELTGPIARAKYLEGIKPVITIPLLGADGRRYPPRSFARAAEEEAEAEIDSMLRAALG